MFADVSAGSAHLDLGGLFFNLTVFATSSFPPYCPSTYALDEPTILDAPNRPGTYLNGTLEGAIDMPQPICNGQRNDEYFPSVLYRMRDTSSSFSGNARIFVPFATFPVVLSIWSEADSDGECLDFQCKIGTPIISQSNYLDVTPALALHKGAPYIVQVSGVDGAVGNFTIAFSDTDSGTGGTDDSGCFPASSLVTVRKCQTWSFGGRVCSSYGPLQEVPLSALEVGDSMLTIASDGSIVLETVYLFTHKDSQKISTFVELATASGQVIRLTRRHFIPRCIGTSPRAECDVRVMVAAEDLQVGDMVGVLNNVNGTKALKGSCIVAVARVVDVGLYAPLTTGGMVVVDSVVASAHSDFVLDAIGVSPAWQHSLYQAASALARGVYHVVGAKTAAWLAEPHGLALTDGVMALTRYLGCWV